MLSVLLLLFTSLLAQAQQLRLIDPTPAESAFWRWLTENGADVSNIGWPAMDPKTGSRGVMALRDLRGTMDGSTAYVRIPDKLMVTEEKAMNDPKFGKAIQEFSLNLGERGLTEYIRIALYILFVSSDPNHFFYPYTQVLPEPGRLGDWTKLEKQEVQDSVLIQASDDHTDFWKQQVMPKLEADPIRFPPEIFTWTKVIWALANVNQRSFSIRDDNNVVLYTALVPGADLLNHMNIKTHYKMVGPTYLLFPYEGYNIKEGEECFNGYGLLDNGHLLENYGFAIPNNKYDNALVEDTETGERILLYWPGAFDDHQPGAVIRSFAVDDSFSDLPSAVNRCMKVTRAALDAFPTQLEKDQFLLEEIEHDQTKWRLRFALIYRIGQKQLIMSYLSFCQSVAEHVVATMSVDEFDQKVWDIVSEDDGHTSWSAMRKFLDDSDAANDGLEPEL